jgi:hypothetical protein
MRLRLRGREATSREPVDTDSSGPELPEATLVEELDHDAAAPAPARRPWWAPRSNASPPASGSSPTASGSSPTASDPDDLSLKPSQMRGSEARYGYIVALELIGVSIVNLVVIHGKGAPKHPATAVAVVGLLASVGLVALVRTHHRIIVPLGAVVAAFFVTLPRVPNSVAETHLLALGIPVIYALIITQRQRKSAAAYTRARRSAGAKTTAAGRKADAADRRRSGQAAQSGRSGRSRRKPAIAPTGPAASRRYTPPKPKRPRP